MTTAMLARTMTMTNYDDNNNNKAIDDDDDDNDNESLFSAHANGDACDYNNNDELR
jgi:hypothetical protein